MSPRTIVAVPVLCLFLIFSGFTNHNQKTNPDQAMNQLVESYVKLVLALGQHDGDYVDAYYGPPQWQEDAKKEKKPLETIKQSAQQLLADLKKIDVSTSEEIVQLRHRYLLKQLESLIARVVMLEGKKFSFDEEAEALYDAKPPHYAESHFKELTKELEALLPGEGSITERYANFKKSFIIPNEKLDTVFKAAIAEARVRTKKYINLPAGESFVVEYVKNKSWSGYNWYKGNYHSLIQINTDLPIYIDRAVDLAAHEGYPGHHVYNVIVEEHLVKERGWIEFSVVPLFAPQSLLMEGSANYGIEVAFPGKERVEFERTVLFPLAGLDPSKAELYYKVLGLGAKLNYAGNEAARRYLNGEINREQAATWLEAYSLMTSDRAKQRVRFIDQYRSYVINYNLGQDLVKQYVESRSRTTDQRWDEFRKLLSSPRLPSGLSK